MKRFLFVFSFICLISISPLLNSSHALAKGVSNEVKQLNTIEQDVNASNWSKASGDIQTLQTYCSDHLWKYQLISNKNEYGKLKDELSKLNGAIKAQDTQQSIIIISYVKSQIREIYNP